MPTTTGDVSHDDLRKGDNLAAIADFNQAIKINPHYTDAYIFRGGVRYDLEDKQGAVADLNQAIKINPNYAQAYMIRGSARYDLEDKQGAVADLQKAANLFQEQGNTDWYQKAIELIRKLQQ